MIGWVLKNWKLFLDIIIVVGAIILFTLFDPFGIFTNRSLKNTANILSSVRDIGELVTAEYYGEVISSLHGTQIYDLEADTLTSEFENCFIDLKYVLVSAVLEEVGDQPRLKNREKRNLQRDILSNRLRDIKADYAPHNVFNYMITFVGYNNIKNNASLFYDADKKRLKRDSDERICEFLLDEIYQLTENTGVSERSLTNKEISDYIYSIPNYFSEVVDFHYQLNREQIKRKKRDIVFIGRGWVKAGYQFNRLDKSNFYYDNTNKIIRFYGLSPVILDNDINPWFIPEKRVKGFELVDFYKRATFEEAKAVKIRCKEELLEQAYKADILTQAQVNGEESLRNFFVLLTNEPDLKVEFHEFPYQKELSLITADTLITVNEALLIDSIIHNESIKINKSISPEKEYYREQLTIFINQLNDLWFIEKGVKFNVFMTDAAKILDHKLFVTKADYDSIKKLRKPVVLELNSEKERFLTADFPDSNKYKSPYPEFVLQFNEMLNVLEAQVAEIDDLREDTLRLDSVQLKKNKIDPEWFIIIKVENTTGLDTIKYFKVVHRNSSRDFKFTNLKYPVLTVPESTYSSFRLSDTTRVDSLINSFVIKTDIKTGDSYGDSLRKMELETIRKYNSWEIKHEIKTRPVMRLTSAVRKIFK